MATYHYHAIYQPPDGTIVNLDGIAKNLVVDTMEDYRALKMDISPEHWGQLTICSLSVIGD